MINELRNNPKMKEQKQAIRKLMAELNGKTMDYETCSMLEEFMNDYFEMILLQIPIATSKIKEDYDLVLKKK